MPQLQAEASVSEDGELHIVLTGAEAGVTLALLLDGRLAASLQAPPPAPGRPAALTLRLPAHLLPARLDVTDPRTGANLLPRPLDLRPRLGLALGPMALQGAAVAGGFTLAWPAGPLLEVELLDEGRVLARGLAHAGGPADPGQPRAWRFAAPLLALPDAKLRLTPRIGGLDLPQHAFALDPAALDLLGRMEGVQDGQVRGWAVAPRRPGHRVLLDCVVDGVVVASAAADQPRADLAELGLGDGRCGVAFALPPLDDARPSSIALAVSGTTMALPGGPVEVQPAPLVGCFDAFHGRSAHGWARDPARPGEPVEVEALGPDGRVLGRARADLFRGDLLDAGIGDGHHAFMIPLGEHFLALVGQEVSVRLAATGEPLPGSPLVVRPNPNLVRFLRRREALAPPVLARLQRMMAHRAHGQGISLIMPVHDTPSEWLQQALLSVHAQWCPAWELICVDDGSTLPHVPDILAQAAAQDPRIRVLRSPGNVGIARAVNFGLRIARHAHVAFLDHDDALEPDAVWQLLRAAATGAELITSDEALTGPAIEDVTEVRARPAFSWDYYLSHPYFVHLLCVPTALARALGGWNEAMAISADVDFVLRVLEQARAVAHIPAVLYRWRTHAASAGHARQGAVMAATRAALQHHLDRRGTGAIVTDGAWFNQFRIDWPPAPGRILIVIPTKNRGDLLQACVGSIERTLQGEQVRIVIVDHASDEPASQAVLHELAQRHVVMPYAGPFNFAAMNNAAVRAHGGDCAFVLFLNNDVEATQPGWLDRLRRLAARGEVGPVGALLLYDDRRVQHAGVILGFNDSAEHALKFTDAYTSLGTAPGTPDAPPGIAPDGPMRPGERRALGTNCALTSVREVSAVTAACLMLRREVFVRLGGFDEGFAIGFNDTDLCLRARALGLTVLYDGHTVLIHHESATRSQTRQVFHPEDTQRFLARWGEAIAAGDPFYSPLLSLVRQDHVLREDAGCRTSHAVRVTRLK